MKPQLFCCGINKKSRGGNLECDHCQCVFQEKDQLNEHHHEIHQFGGKRKLKCCERNSKRKKPNVIHKHLCHYCECTFQEKDGLALHVYYAHQCRDCRQVILTEKVRAQHKIKHEEEQRKLDEALRKREELKEQRRLKCDELVFDYVNTNKLDEYEPDPDFELDIDYIIHHHKLNKDELLRFVQKFELNDILNYGDQETFSCEKVVHLLENGALSVQDVVDYLDSMTYWLGDSDDPIFGLVSYFLDKGYEIKREWVAKVVTDDALVERIKQKYTFTYDDIYRARKQDSMFDHEAWKRFRVQVHKHFPDPDFEDPFADPYADFECVSTEHVSDYLNNRYFYDDEDDQLFIVIRSYPEREVFLGNCQDDLKLDLQTLIGQYNAAYEEYKKANAELNELFEQREVDLSAELTENQRLGVLDDYYHAIDKGTLLERNHWANEVSKLYFVIAQK